MLQYLSFMQDFIRPYDQKLYRLERVMVELDKLKHELDGLPDSKKSAALDMARDYLAIAQEATEGQPSADRAWRYLHAAYTARLPALDAASFKAQATKLNHEAAKLGGWRREVIKDLIEEVLAADKLMPEALMLAATVLYEHYDNQAYKQNLFSRLKGQLIVMLAAAVASAMWVLHALPAVASENETAVSMPVAVAVFGWLGASTSAILRAADATTTAKIPEIATLFRVTALRIAAGVASALAIYLVLNGGNTQLLGIELSADESGSTLLLFAFAAGFTERLVMKVMERMA